jgi:hypothetical protein
MFTLNIIYKNRDLNNTWILFNFKYILLLNLNYNFYLKYDFIQFKKNKIKLFM